MTCRAKTYGFMEEGQKEKMEGSGALSTQGTNNLLNGAYPPEECGSQRLDMYWGRVSRTPEMSPGHFSKGYDITGYGPCWGK